MLFLIEKSLLTEMHPAMCCRTRTTIVQGLQLKEKGILIFSSSCLCRCRDTGASSFGILSTQQLTSCGNGGGTRINPICTAFSALKADICEQHMFEDAPCSIPQSSDAEVEIPPHTGTPPQSPQCRDPDPGARAGQEHLAPFLITSEILWAGFMANHCSALQSTLSLNWNNHSYSPSNSLLAQT